ncbi:PREDICTED: spidroin-2-like [Sturnus vulgaris]|uniref:spidroin-2-like n=1 Tax=Sturnus vulgaris TaxID=9172 RepID=UPI00071A62FE|nr:PREDICTED: spidroin-2-like [Sturnus vulgaris]
MLTDYPEGVTAVPVLVFSNTTAWSQRQRWSPAGRAAGRGIWQRRTGGSGSRSPAEAPDPLQGRAGSPGAATAASSPGESRDAELRRGTRAPAGTGTAQRARERTRQRTKRQEPSAPRLRLHGETLPESPVHRGFRCAQSRGSAAGPGTGEVNPPGGGGTGQHLPAPPHSPARAGMAGTTPASSAGAVPAGPAAGTPPESPSRLPAQAQRAALTCGGWGRAAPAALRSAPAPFSCAAAAASLHGHLRAGRGGAGPGAGPPRGRSPDMHTVYMGGASHANEAEPRLHLPQRPRAHE